ncbi:EamA family transporter [Pontibacillus marinus]|uniref:Transporter n=1 Tax=Pontibacillus marinus BH030004 = DSM 16465 TaxID=1385511 RepID=A0A0A5GEV6_9BACI|nr:EamA family transporter [Pontibacillus marinus]KGX89655.1 transporter [Pontibacillus marinus BH030004 = DSM 16465]
MKGKFSTFLVLLAAILWGTKGSAQTFTPENAHPIAVGTMRLAVGGGSLLFVALLLGQVNLKNWPIKATILASLSMAFYQPMFFSAVHITGVAIGTVIAIGSAPILAGVLERVFLKRRLSKVWWYSTFLSILGCTLLFINTGSVQVNPYGILMALGAGLSFASYAMVSEKLVKEHSSLSVIAIVFTLSAFLLLPFLFVYDMSWVTEARGLMVSLHLGIIATGLAYFLFARGLIHTPSSTAVTLSLAEPLTAALLGVFLVGERLELLSWMGISLLLVGITMLIVSPKRSA